ERSCLAIRRHAKSLGHRPAGGLHADPHSIPYHRGSSRTPLRRHLLSSPFGVGRPGLGRQTRMKSDRLVQTLHAYLFLRATYNAVSNPASKAARSGKERTTKFSPGLCAPSPTAPRPSSVGTPSAA